MAKNPLEQRLAAQDQEIASLKKAINKLERMLKQIGAKADRAYHSGRRNETDIQNLTVKVGRNG